MRQMLGEGERVKMEDSIRVPRNSSEIDMMQLFKDRGICRRKLRWARIWLIVSRVFIEWTCYNLLALWEFLLSYCELAFWSYTFLQHGISNIVKIKSNPKSVLLLGDCQYTTSEYIRHGGMDSEPKILICGWRAMLWSCTDIIVESWLNF